VSEQGLQEMGITPGRTALYPSQTHQNQLHDLVELITLDLAAVQNGQLTPWLASTIGELALHIALELAEDNPSRACQLVGELTKILHNHPRVPAELVDLAMQVQLGAGCPTDS